MTKGLTKTQTHNILESINHQPEKRLGQNFLIDKNIVDKAVQMAGLEPSDTVIEVGTGLGTLTQAMLETGATVYAIEKDPKLYNYLNEKLSPIYPDSFNFIHGDAVELPLGRYNPNDGDYFKILANLPYNVSTPWLEKVLFRPTLPKTMTLMLQKEAADRYLANHGCKTFSPISILLQAAFELDEKHKVTGECFYPKPSINSLLIHLKIKDNPYRIQKSCYEFIRKLFNFRRKQIGKYLKEGLSTDQLEQLQNQKIFPSSIRAEDIPLEDWIKLDALF